MPITYTRTGPYFTAPSNHQLPPPTPPKRAARRQLIHLMYAFVTCKRTHIYQGQEKKCIDRIERRALLLWSEWNREQSRSTQNISCSRNKHNRKGCCRCVAGCVSSITMHRARSGPDICHSAAAAAAAGCCCCCRRPTNRSCDSPRGGPYYINSTIMHIHTESTRSQTPFIPPVSRCMCK